MEPLSQLTGLAPEAEVTAAAAVPAFVEFSRKMVESLFNYAASFAVTPAQLQQQQQQQQLEMMAAARPSEDATFVPFSTLRTWYANFERRLRQNPNFWKN